MCTRAVRFGPVYLEMLYHYDSYAVLEFIFFFWCRLVFIGDAFDDGPVDADSYASEGVFDSFVIELCL